MSALLRGDPCALLGWRGVPPDPKGPSRSRRTTEWLLTVPNVITFVRLACLPVFVCLLFGRDNRAAAALAARRPRRHRLGRRLHRPPLRPGVDARQGARPGGRPAAVLRRASAAILVDGAVPGAGSLDACSSVRCVVAGATVGAGGHGGPAHRRHLVRQGRHVRPDVRLPARSSARTARVGAPSCRRRWRGSPACPASCCQLLAAALYVPIGLRCAARGPGGAGPRAEQPGRFESRSGAA